MAKQAKAAKVSSKNSFEEMVAIQLNVRFWPGQAKLKPADLGLKENEVPEIFYLGNKKLSPRKSASSSGTCPAKPGVT